MIDAVKIQSQIIPSIRASASANYRYRTPGQELDQGTREGGK